METGTRGERWQEHTGAPPELAGRRRRVGCNRRAREARRRESARVRQGEGEEPPASPSQARRRQARNQCRARGRWARGREGGAPPQAAPVLDRARGTPRARWTRGRGRAQAHSGPETHEDSLSAPEVRHETRVTPPQPQCTPPAVPRAPSTYPLPIRSGHEVAPNDRLGGRGAHRTQEATQSEHGPADSSPHRIRLPPEVF